MSRILSLFGFFVLATVALAQGAAPVSAPQVALLAHRAIYEITLAASKGRNRLNSASGRMVYEFTGNVCEGYTTNTRFVTDLDSGDGERLVTDMRSNLHENAKDDEIRFVTQTYSNQKLSDQADGSAKRDSAGNIQIELKPGKGEKDAKPAHFGLGKNILFPTAHMIAALDAARKGETIFQADFYDGSEGGHKVYATTGVLGKPMTGEIPENHPVAKTSFAKMRRFPMSLAFFEKDGSEQGEQSPAYSLSTVVFENGVTYSMRLDYGDFTLNAAMASLEVLPSKNCK